MWMRFLNIVMIIVLWTVLLNVWLVPWIKSRWFDPSFDQDIDVDIVVQYKTAQGDPLLVAHMTTRLVRGASLQRAMVYLMRKMSRDLSLRASKARAASKGDVS
jgi:hypothetical protein